MYFIHQQYCLHKVSYLAVVVIVYEGAFLYYRQILVEQHVLTHSTLTNPSQIGEFVTIVGSASFLSNHGWTDAEEL